MSATYCKITIEEMRELLRMEKGWTETVSGDEKVFAYQLKSPQDVVIKVYSGIRASTNEAKANGQDALRVSAVNTRLHLGWIKAKRCNRTQNWRDNLKERVLKVIEQSKARAGVKH
jgi:hypothetical protein